MIIDPNMTVETVKVKSARHSRGYVIINKADFDAQRHELYGVEPEPEPKAKTSKAKE